MFSPSVTDTILESLGQSSSQEFQILQVFLMTEPGLAIITSEFDFKRSSSKIYIIRSFSSSDLVMIDLPKEEI